MKNFIRIKDCACGWHKGNPSNRDDSSMRWKVYGVMPDGSVWVSRHGSRDSARRCAKTLRLQF